jgi:hypothetical protein
MLVRANKIAMGWACVSDRENKKWIKSAYRIFLEKILGKRNVVDRDGKERTMIRFLMSTFP